jgi:ADP-heptose:LPS heptosyltransferase
VRTLVYRAIGLGDALTGVPALRALRRARPDDEIALAAPATLAPLIGLADVVDRVIPTAELEPVAWEGPPPGLAIDLHGNGPASRTLLERLAPGRLVAFERPGGPRWDPAEHERVRWCRLLHEELGIAGDPDDVRLRPPDDPPAHAGVVLVHPGAASGSRRWPAERFAAVARHLADTGHDVRLTGSAAEGPLAEEVRRRAGLAPESVMAGRTDLLELAALVAGARLVLCGDTGMAHLASAYATASVILFGPIPPSAWGPPPGPHTVLWHGAGRRGDPHGALPDPALLEIGVEEVVEAVDARLRRPASPAPPPSSARSA